MQIEVQIDKAGRVVIPKEIREQWGFSPDKPLWLNTLDDGVMLRPAEQPKMVNKDGIWVMEGDTPADYDIISLINNARDEGL